VERARVLLVLCDLSPFAELSPSAQLDVLLDELGRYQPELVERPRLVVGSRADLAEPDVLGSWSPQPALSAVTGEGIDGVLGGLRRLVEAARLDDGGTEGFVTLRPVPEGVQVVRHDDASFEVVGRAALRAVGLSSLEDLDALDEARRRLDRLGVDRALARAGARDGDVVHIGAFTFTFESADQLDLQPFDEATGNRVAAGNDDDGDGT
jgi:GTP-binding protein